MSRGKHGPNRLNHYLSIHARAMADHVAGAFVTEDGVEFDVIVPRKVYVLKGTIKCLGHLSIDVEKYLEVVDRDGGCDLVQTKVYTYNAHIDRICNVFRYCSPHDDHHTEHHRHEYDVFGNRKQVKGSPRFLTAEEWPTLGEVIAELRDWYYSDGCIERLDVLHANLHK